MQIKMLQTMPGSPDGVTVNTYEEGRTYDMPDDLAKVFIENEWAEPVGARHAVPDKTKDQGAAPENKSGDGSNPPDYESMSKEDLKNLAGKRGINFHILSGKPKLIELLTASDSGNK